MIIKDFYTVAELASCWRVSLKHIYALVQKGELPAIKLGRAIRFPFQTIERFMEDQLNKTAR